MALIKSNRSASLYLLLLLVLFLIFNACSEDKPTEPENNNNNTVAAATIGTGGGELKTDDFSLFVPSGSFLNDVEISLSTNNEYFLTDENSASETFIVSGIPSDFTNNLRVAIRYNGTVIDSSYIACAMTNDESFLTDSLYVFSMLSTIDSSGFLVAKIPNSILNHSSLNKSSSEHTFNSDRVQVMFKIIPSLSTYRYGNIIIDYPPNISLEAKNFAERMNRVLEIFIYDFNFDFKYNNSLEYNNVKYSTGGYGWKWPLKFIVLEKGGTRIAKSPLGFTEEGNISFTIQKVLLAEPWAKQASMDLAHSLMTLLEGAFNAKQANSFDNLHNAIKLWLPTYLYPDNYEDPPAYLSEESLDVFKGFRESNISIELATIIKYLIDYQEFDVNNFGPIFEEAHDKNTNHYYSLFLKVDELLMDWFPDYYEKYITGNVFSISGSSFLPPFTELWEGSYWKIDSESDVSEVFTKNYNDLSAKRYIIELNYEFGDESTSLLLDAYKSSAANNDNVATIVFGVDAKNNLEHLVTGREELVEIPNLKWLYQNGTKKFLVVVVNCINNGTDYQGVTEIDLVAKIKSEEVNLDFNTCDLLVYVKGRKNYVSPDTNYTGNDAIIDPGAKFTGSFSNNTFSASFTDTVGSVIKTGSIEAALDESQTSVVSLDWTEQQVNSYHQWIRTKALSAQNIPLSSSVSGLKFAVSGESVTDYIITLRDDQSSTNGLSYVIQDFWSEADSYIKVTFSNKD